MRQEFALALQQLDGQLTLMEVSNRTGADLEHFQALVHALHASCILEDDSFAQWAAQSPWRRVLNFLGDYIPSNDVQDAFARLSDTEVIVLGVGAVGSWAATELCQSGVGRLVLVDKDTVETSNLNRSLYTQSNVGQYKVDALAQRLQRINPQLVVRPLRQMMSDSDDLAKLLQDAGPASIVINCADSPSVDATSAMVDAACQRAHTAYVIAGGYNLHLSLIGMTVLPGKSACYHCGRLTLENLQGDELVGLRKLARPWRNIGNLAPLAAITASFAANEVIRVALSDSRIPPAMVNRRGEFNFLTSEMHFTSLPPRPECGCIS
ncbi:ThiF family adenylyltransferase [Uliginosibacterium paludis]|uniref:ThiF family adenylyltransferase n=1 Tax=Uliginosibacterium paludis TaxID=1615952 RepID=A0ABV2CTF1_9RHOO